MGYVAHGRFECVDELGCLHPAEIFRLHSLPRHGLAESDLMPEQCWELELELELELALSWGGRSTGHMLFSMASAGPGVAPISDGFNTSQSARIWNRLFNRIVCGTFGCMNFWELRLRRGMLNIMSSPGVGMGWLEISASCLAWYVNLDLFGWAGVVVAIVVCVVCACVVQPGCTLALLLPDRAWACSWRPSW